MTPMEFLARSYFGNTLLNWGIALVLIPVLYAVFRLVLRILASRLGAISALPFSVMRKSSPLFKWMR